MTVADNLKSAPLVPKGCGTLLLIVVVVAALILARKYWGG